VYGICLFFIFLQDEDKLNMRVFNIISNILTTVSDMLNNY